jgi:soluble lytic murein transglycosylase
MFQSLLVRCLTPVLAASVSFAVSQSAIASDQDTFIAARAAYKSRDDRALSAYAMQLRADNYVLAPYLDYWSLLLKLEKADADEVQEFLLRYADYPFAERVRSEWLKVLGKRKQWGAIVDAYVPVEKEDVSVSCYAAQARYLQGQSMALSDAKPLWITGADQPATCDDLFSLMKNNGVLTDEDVWARMRLAFQANRVTVARAASRYLSEAIDANRLKLYDKVYENPQRMLEKRQINLNSRFGRELAMYAIERVARTQLALSTELWSKIRTSFNSDEQSYVWSRIALYAAKQHDSQALAFYKKADGATLDSEQLAWETRAALRASDWDAVLATVAAMQQSQQNESAWRYWKARALKEKGNITAANALLVPLANEHSFYGLLAGEEMGEAMRAPPLTYQASDSDVAVVKALPGIQRATELYQLDMRWEAKTEWLRATRGFDDKQLIAAAELAFRQEWYDVAISTADKTALTHDFALRYPTPYRETMEAYVRDNQLDEAWVYGLIRQESRFVSFARSGVGAAGLMQVMPVTAKWIAKRMGMGDYHPGLIHRVETNLELGTYYLRHVLDAMNGQPLMATAAYNAGPSRPKRWADSKPMEGAVYAETIPFTETRDYVEKVMANAQFYARRLGAKLQTFKQRIGIVGQQADTAVATTEDNP